MFCTFDPQSLAHENPRKYRKPPGRKRGTSTSLIDPRPRHHGRREAFVNYTAATTGRGEKRVTLVTCNSLFQYADQEKYVGFFWDAYLPGSKSFTPEAGHYTAIEWTNVAQSLTGDLLAVRLAIVANSLCMLGIRHREHKMTLQGHRVYGLALGEMQRALKRPNRLDMNGSLIAAWLIGLFTLLFGKTDDLMGQPQAWAGLSAGEKSLYMLYSPNKFRDGAAHRSFKDARLHLMNPSLLSGTTSSLGSADWMTIPWSITSKTPLDKLVDLGIQAAGLLHSLKCFDPQSHISEARGSLVTRCRDFMAELVSWYDETIPTLAIELPVEKVGATRASPVDLAKTHTLLLFWSISLLTCPWISATLFEVNMPPGFDLHNLRHNILSHLRSFMSPTAGWFGINMSMLPVSVVFKTIGLAPLSAREERLIAALYKNREFAAIGDFFPSVTQYFSNPYLTPERNDVHEPLRESHIS
ncbi:hypothetical protein N7454_005976 [Penicillium verhagenii]|nr:hypothetical protein N7454_005976 [Penicillium verhagenii]